MPTVAAWLASSTWRSSGFSGGRSPPSFPHGSLKDDTNLLAGLSFWLLKRNASYFKIHSKRLRENRLKFLFLFS